MTAIIRGTWAGHVYPSQERNNRVHINLRSGVRIINTEILPEQLENFDPDKFWNMALPRPK